MRATLISDGRGGIPRDFLFEDVDPAELEAALVGPYPTDFPYHCLLVRTDAAVVLVDTGLGAAEHPFGGSGGSLQSELERAGVTPEAVDVVVVTHRHLDHIGGNVRAGAPAFPHARYLMSRIDWDFSTSEASLAEMSPFAVGPAREQLPPLAEAGVLELVDDEVEVVPGVRAFPAPGHTAGHLAVEVSGELLYLVDALFHPLQAARPGWGHGLDAEPEVAEATLRALLDRAVEHDLPVAGSHLEVVFSVECAGDAFRLTPV